MGKNIGIGVRQICLQNLALSPLDGDVGSRKSVRKNIQKLKITPKCGCMSLWNIA